MTDHDPLCWRKQDYVPICSMCVLIASVRANERERIAQALNEVNWTPIGSEAARFLVEQCNRVLGYTGDGGQS